MTLPFQKVTFVRRKHEKNSGYKRTIEHVNLIGVPSRVVTCDRAGDTSRNFEELPGTKVGEVLFSVMPCLIVSSGLKETRVIPCNNKQRRKEMFSTI